MNNDELVQANLEALYARISDLEMAVYKLSMVLVQNAAYERRFLRSQATCITRSPLEIHNEREYGHGETDDMAGDGQDVRTT